MRASFAWSITLTLCWGLVGCGLPADSPFDATPLSVKRHPALLEQTPPKITKPDNTTSPRYRPRLVRDPFRPHFLTARPQEPAKKVEANFEIKRPRSQLEKYRLEQLKLVATITNVQRPRAIVESQTDGRRFIVRPGTLIGFNGECNTQIVQKILPSAIVIFVKYGVGICSATHRRIHRTVTISLIPEKHTIDGVLHVDGRRVHELRRDQVRLTAPTRHKVPTP